MKIFLLLSSLLVWQMSAPAFGQDKDYSLLPGVKGKDDRVLVESNVGPWRAVGRVNVRAGGHCTGTLVAPRTVVTAAHCIWNKRTLRWYPPVSLHFLAGYSRGDYVAHARITHIKAPDNYIAALKAKKLPHDWAILTLDKDISGATGIIPLVSDTGTAFLKGLNKQREILQAGYSQDKPHMLTLNRVCKIVGLSQKLGLMHHNCDTVKGDSGSPIFQRRGRKLVVIGIHVATALSMKPTLGIAVLKTNFR